MAKEGQEELVVPKEPYVWLGRPDPVDRLSARDRARGRKITAFTGGTAGLTTLILVAGVYAGWASEPPVPTQVQHERIANEARNLYSSHSVLGKFLLTYVNPERVMTSTGPGTRTAIVGQTCLQKIATVYQVGRVESDDVSILPAGFGKEGALHFKTVNGMLVPVQETAQRMQADGCQVVNGDLAVRDTTADSAAIEHDEATWEQQPPISPVEAQQP